MDNKEKLHWETLHVICSVLVSIDYRVKKLLSQTQGLLQIPHMNEELLEKKKQIEELLHTQAALEGTVNQLNKTETETETERDKDA